jgi:methylenetetrahydrofolate dehydrogenase (NADP+)/methenyltetrahydrofolate cyclohydrolase
MTAKIIDGVAVARDLRAECRDRILRLQTSHGVTPSLSVILVGENSASKAYVRNKIRACEDIGILSRVIRFPADVDPQVVVAQIEELNADPATDGILVQLPLPPQFRLEQILSVISAEKDVDGFHLYNVGGLVIGNTVFPPCTP